MRTRILVTGSSGAIGTRLCEKLLEENYWILFTLMMRFLESEMHKNFGQVKMMCLISLLAKLS